MAKPQPQRQPEPVKPPAPEIRPPIRLALIAGPLFFFAAFLIVYGLALSTFSVPFFKYFSDTYAPGQAIRACLIWCGAELGIPLAGALAGAVVASFISRRLRQ